MKQLTAICGSTGALLIAALGCSGLSDPATRTAYCLESATKQRGDQSQIEISCDPEVDGGYVAFFHPEGNLTQAEWDATGLPAPVVTQIKKLRLSEEPGIYVVPAAGSSMRDSFTTYQMNFIQIPRPLAVRRESAKPMSLTIARPGEQWAIVGAK